MNKKYAHIIIGIFSFIALMLVSFSLEVGAYTFVKSYILPYGKFEWGWRLALRVYLLYFSFAAIIIILIYKYKENIKNSRILSLVTLYVLWLSFPTGTYWVIYNPHHFGNSPPIFLIVPNVLTVESAFVFFPGCKYLCPFFRDVDFNLTLTNIYNIKLYYFTASFFVYLLIIQRVKFIHNFIFQGELLSKAIWASSLLTWIFIFVLSSLVAWNVISSPFLLRWLFFSIMEQGL